MAQASKIDAVDQPTRDIWPLSWVSGSVIQGDCHHSQDPDDQTELLVWLSREPLSSESKKKFLDHVQKLLKIKPFKGIDFGIDSESRAFVAMPKVTGKRLNYDSPSITVLRNRYLKCLFMIASFYKQDLTCGNLSPASFSVNLDGSIAFVGYLGGFECALDRERMNACLHYVRSNDRHPGRPAAAADVYALAVIGLELFGADFGATGVDFNDFDRHLQQVPEGSPPWVFSVLATIARDPNHILCRDVKELLRSIEVGEGSYLKELRSAGHGTRSDGGAERPLTFRQIQDEFVTRAELLKRRIDQIAESKFIKIALSVMAVAMTAPVISNHFLSSSNSISDSVHTVTQEPEKKLSAQDDVSKSLWNLVDQARKAREDMAKSGVTTTEIVVDAVDSVILMAKKAGPLAQTISGLKYDSDDGKKLVAAYEASDDESRAILSGAIVDAGGEWESWYRQQVISSIERAGITKDESLNSFGTDALFLAAETRMSSHAGEIWGRQSRISDDQLWWLLQFHSKKRTPLVPFLAREANQRKLLEWPKGVFLEAMTSAQEASFPPYESLYRAAKGGLSVSDVNAISAWNDPLAIKALYAVSLSTRETPLLTRAVTGLVLQPVFDLSPRPVLDLLRNSQEVELWRYSKIIGGLGLNTAEADPFLVEGLRDLKDEPSFGAIVTALIDNGSALAVEALLRVHGGDVHPDRLIKLLGHPDLSVRRDVIPFLRQVRITSSKEKIRDFYDRENDPEVRRLYESELFHGKDAIGTWLVSDSDKRERSAK